MNQAQLLYQLQMVDLVIDDRRLRLAEVDRLLAEQSAVQTAEQALQDADAALAPWRVQVNDLNLEIKTLNNKLTGVEQRLYSGKVKNPKELQDMQEETAALKRRRGTLEDQLLEAMIEVETGQANYTELDSVLATATAQWEADQTSLSEERAQILKQLDDLARQRAAAAAKIEPDNLARYKRLRPQRHGQAIALLDGNQCKTCGSTQTTTLAQQVRQGRELGVCEICGRILALP